MVLYINPFGLLNGNKVDKAFNIMVFAKGIAAILWAVVTRIFLMENFLLVLSAGNGTCSMTGLLVRLCLGTEKYLLGSSRPGTFVMFSSFSKLGLHF